MSRSWQKIGEVTGTDKPKAGEKVNYEGKQWDYVFDVAIEDGAPALKLPYNVSGMHPILSSRVTVSLRSRTDMTREPIHGCSSLPGTERPAHAPPRRHGSIY